MNFKFPMMIYIQIKHDIINTQHRTEQDCHSILASTYISQMKTSLHVFIELMMICGACSSTSLMPMYK